MSAPDTDTGRVAGKCPACGWQGLFLGSGGYVTCSQTDCPNPTLAADILNGGYLAMKRAVEFLEIVADGGGLRINGVLWREMFSRFNQIISDGVVAVVVPDPRAASSSDRGSSSDFQKGT